MAVRAMLPQEAAEKAIRKEPLFILDVRNPADFADWKIEGERFKHLNIPYYELIDGVEEILEQLPAEEEIVVVCAKEGSSVMVAELLAEQGRDAAYLKGGMRAWSELLMPLKIGDLKEGGELYQFVRIGKGCLSYMLVSGQEAALFDATRMTEVYTDFAAKMNVQIKHVLDTHLHADHISGGRAIAESAGAKYWLPAKDAGEAAFKYEPLKDGDEILLGSSVIRIEALHTPGHTAGSTSFLIDDQYLLTGDILFIDSIGRPDLAGHAEDWAGDLRKTLYSGYKELPGELVVLPAHFMILDELNADGTVAKKLGELFEENHGLNIRGEEEFRWLVTKSLPQQPHAYLEIRQTNMGMMQPNAEQQRDMEIGPNRCAVR